MSVDCCDGSDEYDGRVKCPNTCWEAGKVARDKLKKRIATYQDGVIIRRKEVERAKGAFAKQEEELSKLKNEEKIVKGLVQQLKGLISPSQALIPPQSSRSMAHSVDLYNTVYHSMSFF